MMKYLLLILALAAMLFLGCGTTTSSCVAQCRETAEELCKEGDQKCIQKVLNGCFPVCNGNASSANGCPCPSENEDDESKSSRESP